MPTNQQIEAYKALVSSYRVLSDLVELGDKAHRDDRFLTEAMEEAGFRVVDYRKKHGITQEHVKYGCDE